MSTLTAVSTVGPSGSRIEASLRPTVPRRGQSLSGPARLVISPLPPYHVQGSFIKPSHFRTADCAQEGRTLWQTIRVDGHFFGVRLSGNDVVWHPRVYVDVYGKAPLPAPRLALLTALLCRRFDTDANLTPFFHLVKKTALARSTLLEWMGSRPTCAYSLYELLVVLICLQNTHVRRTAAMMQRLFETYGQLVRFDGQSLWTFWEPRALVGEEDRLRELHLGYRARTLEKLSRHFARDEREIEDRLWGLPDAELSNSLQELPGVGPATAGGLTFDYFHRYDSLTYLPPWETKIFSRLFRRLQDSSSELVELAHNTWPGYSRLALHLLFEDQFWKLRTQRSNVLAGLVPPP